MSEHIPPTNLQRAVTKIRLLQEELARMTRSRNRYRKGYHTMMKERNALHDAQFKSKYGFSPAPKGR